MKRWIALWLISLSLWAQTQVSSELARHSNVVGTVARLEAFSGTYLGLPYGDGGPLGEGPEGRYDQDPLYRFDTFDCTTFVETMTALALSETPEEFEDHLREIRYENGVIDYVTRNHFPSLQWIPHNIANGYWRDVTRELVEPKQIKVARALINLPRHYEMKKLEELRVFDIPSSELPARLLEWQQEGSRLRATEATLDYIAIDWLVNNSQILTKIPSGSVVNFVRPNWDLTAVIGTHMNVSHQGLIFQRNGKTWLRHASVSGDKRVKEELFLDYIRKFVGHATLKGVHFMAPARL